MESSESVNAPRAERLFKYQQVAEMWNMSESTIKQFVRERLLRTIVVGRNTRIPESALAEFIRARSGIDRDREKTTLSAPATKPRRRSKTASS